MVTATSGELLFEIAPSKSIDVQFIRGVDKFVKVGVEMLLSVFIVFSTQNTNVQLH